MSDSKHSDHWDLLASVLGAEPQKREPVEEPAAMVEEQIAEDVEDTADIQETVTKPSCEPPPSPPARALSNWDALAMKLGVEIKAEPPQPPATVPSPITKKTEPKPVAPTERPRDFVKPAGKEFGKKIEPYKDAKAASAQESDKSDDNKSRRNRRHRYKGKDQGRSSEGMKKSAVHSGLETPADEDLIDISLEIDNKVGREIEEDSEESKTGTEIKKHRRSRRGSRKKKKQGGELAQEKQMPASKGSFAGRAEPIDNDKSSREFSSEDDVADEEHEEGDQRVAKSGFRSLPTWEEAVGCIIAKNIEAHPKRQSSGSSRSRSADSHKRGRR